MNESSKQDEYREIRINPIVPTESVLVSTARGLRPRKAEKPLEHSAKSKVDTCPFIAKLATYGASKRELENSHS